MNFAPTTSSQPHLLAQGTDSAAAKVRAGWYASTAGASIWSVISTAGEKLRVTDLVALPKLAMVGTSSWPHGCE